MSAVAYEHAAQEVSGFGCHPNSRFAATPSASITMAGTAWDRRCPQKVWGCARITTRVSGCATVKLPRHCPALTLIPPLADAYESVVGSSDSWSEWLCGAKISSKCPHKLWVAAVGTVEFTGASNIVQAAPVAPSAKDKIARLGRITKTLCLFMCRL